jgi:hypothetical protein
MEICFIQKQGKKKLNRRILYFFLKRMKQTLETTYEIGV